jgi:hypothetical protein
MVDQADSVGPIYIDSCPRQTHLRSPVETNLARELLESHGIWCFLADVHCMSMEGEAFSTITGPQIIRPMSAS